MTGPEHHQSARVRAAATVARLAEAGLDPVAAAAARRVERGVGRQAVGVLLARNIDVDAVVCGSDQIARGAADTLREAGRQVPQDVALAGFDNWDVIALASRPPLTSIDMDLEGLGRAAAELLLKAIEGDHSPGIHAHPAKLVIRDSTVPA